MAKIHMPNGKASSDRIKKGVDAFKQNRQFTKNTNTASAEHLKATEKAGKSATYGQATADDWSKVADKSAFENTGGWDKYRKIGSTMSGNIQNAAVEEGRTVLGMMGSHAIRGAAWGAVGGGTIEAAQGGSFWDGAKSGAVNGAVGWTGYRMAMKGTGASSMNPFSKNGVFASGNNLHRAFSADKAISGQAQAILNNRQLAGVAQGVMNQRNKIAKV